MEEIQIKIKMTSNAQVYTVKIAKSETILKLKEACEKETKIPPLSQNLVYKGRILANEKLISDYNIENDHTIILVKNIQHQHQMKQNLQQLQQIIQQVQIQIIQLIQIKQIIRIIQIIIQIIMQIHLWEWEDKCQIYPI